MKLWDTPLEPLDPAQLDSVAVVALWRHVLAQAIIDARWAPNGHYARRLGHSDTSQKRSAECSRLRAEARRWLTMQGRHLNRLDFIEVCENAGFINPSEVSDVAMSMAGASHVEMIRAQAAAVLAMKMGQSDADSPLSY
jgi:hypothetical protein